MAYGQMSPFNAFADESSMARYLNFGQRLHLHPNFVYTSREGSGESAHSCRLTRAFVT